MVLFDHIHVDDST